MAPPGSTVWLPYRPSYSCILSIFGQIAVVNDTFLNVKLSQIPHGKSSRSLWLYMLHLCQWFYIWLHCYTECTVFLCGWWQWWGSRVEMGFSCSCSSLTLAQQMGKNSTGVEEVSLSTYHIIFTIAPKWAIFLMTCNLKNDALISRTVSTQVTLQVMCFSCQQRVSFPCWTTWKYLIKLWMDCHRYFLQTLMVPGGWIPEILYLLQSFLSVAIMRLIFVVLSEISTLHYLLLN